MTRPDQTLVYALKSVRGYFYAHYYLPVRKILIKFGFLKLRTKCRLFIWKLERSVFRVLRHRKTVCVLTVDASNGGLFALFRYFLGGIAYADRRGMLPVVDMKNTHNVYLSDDEVGHVNAWEYYFEQPSGIPLEEAERSPETITLKVGRYLYPAKIPHCS